MLMNKVEFCQKNVFFLVSPGTYWSTCYILKRGNLLNMNQWFIPSDFIKRISNYGCYGYNRLKRTSVATIAPPLVDSKHCHSFPFTPIWVDPLCCQIFWLTPQIRDFLLAFQAKKVTSVHTWDKKKYAAREKQDDSHSCATSHSSESSFSFLVA